MAREYLVDNLKNFSAQGDLVTLTFDRMTMVDGKEEPVGEAVVKLTMKGQNLVNMTNALGNILEKVKDVGILVINNMKRLRRLRTKRALKISVYLNWDGSGFLGFW